MNKFQRKESKAVRRMISYCPIRLQMDANYKHVRRRMRKTLRFLMKANQKTYKDAITGMDLANGSDQTAYIRQDLIHTVCVAEAIKFKLVGFNCRRYDNHIEVKNE